MDKKKVLAIIVFLIFGFFMFTFASPVEDEKELEDVKEDLNRGENLTTSSEEENILNNVESNISTNNLISNINDNLSKKVVKNLDILLDDNNVVINNDKSIEENDNQDVKDPVIYIVPKVVRILRGEHFDLMSGVTTSNKNDFVFIKPIDILTETLEIGTHEIIYQTSQDKNGSVITEKRTIIVYDPFGDEDGDGYTNKEEVDFKTDFLDKESYPNYDKRPTITIDEENIYEINIFDDIPSFKATAYDQNDGNINVDITHNINNNEEGVYKVTFKATDSLGNETVIIKDFKVIDNRIEVTFVDYNDKVINIQKVFKNDELKIPDMSGKNYTKNGITYQFSGWDKNIDDIDKDTTVKALYDITLVTVKTYLLNSGVERPLNGLSAGVKNYTSLNSFVELQLNDEIKKIIKQNKTKVYALDEDIYSYIDKDSLPESEKLGYHYDWYVLKYERDGWHLDAQEVKTIYSLSVNELEKATISLNKNTATYDEEISFEIDVEKGYEINSITVTDSDGNNLNLEENSGKYYFKMPASNVDVNVVISGITKIEANTYLLNSGVERPLNGLSAGVKNYRSLNKQVFIQVDDIARNIINENKIEVLALDQNVYNYVNIDELPKCNEKGYHYEWYVLKHENDGWHLDAEKVKTLYSLTVDNTNGGIISLDKIEANYGDIITVTTTPNIGYELDKIYVNGEELNQNTFNMPANDVTVTATFKKIEYNITVENTVNGTISVSNNKANYGDIITVTTTPNVGYELDKIYVNGKKLDGNTFTVTENAKVTAVFIQTTSNFIVKYEANYHSHKPVITIKKIDKDIKIEKVYYQDNLLTRSRLSNDDKEVYESNSCNINNALNNIVKIQYVKNNKRYLAIYQRLTSGYKFIELKQI